MARYIVLPAAAASGTITAVDASARAGRARASFVGSSIAQVVPATWNGVGAVPVGWTIPAGVLVESGGTRVAIVGGDAFAGGAPQFNGAATDLPGDWLR